MAMIMRITWGKLHPGKWSAYEQTYRTTVVAKTKGLKGLRGRWLVQDADDKDAGFAVSLWDSMEDMRAYEQSDFYRREILGALQPFFVGEFKTNRCEVKFTQELQP
jgi:heme-degrading monooxygenase HmoA